MPLIILSSSERLAPRLTVTDARLEAALCTVIAWRSSSEFIIARTKGRAPNYCARPLIRDGRQF